MEDTVTTTTEKLLEKAEKYAKTSFEILELKVAAKIADVFSTITSGIAIVVVVTLFCFILSIGLSYYIGQFLIEEYYGFFVVSLFYLVFLLFIYYNRSKWLKEPIKNIIISSFFEHQKDKSSEIQN